MRKLIFTLLFLLMFPCSGYCSNKWFTFDAYNRQPGQSTIDAIKGMYGMAFMDFYNQMKDSALFRVMPRVSDGDLGDGDPVITIDAGHYGVQSIDLSQWPETIYLIIRGFIIIPCMFVAGRVVMLGRD